MREKILNCYDSHVHWLGTGQKSAELNLRVMSSPEGIQNLSIDHRHFRGEWLVGFGWNDNHWDRAPHRNILDALFPNHPVALTRVDGHALWVNSKVIEILKEKGIQERTGSGGKIIRDESGEPTGIFIDQAMEPILQLIPPHERSEIKQWLRDGVSLFHRAGFTHIRDLSCSEMQWDCAIELDQSKELALAIEQYFSVDEGRTFDQVLKFALNARREATENLRAEGIKVYFDGALGSEGAYLSQPYLSGSGRGLCLLSEGELREIITRTWENQFDLAIHTIGDEAADQVVSAACRVKQSSLNGRIHLEHAQMLRPETIEKMKGLNIICHMQPCHWLSDRHWLEEKLGDLAEFCFQWRALENAKIPFDFGSDSPIEPTSLFRNLQALKESSLAGIPPLQGEARDYHTHRDLQWTPETYSTFKEEQVQEVYFRGERVFSTPNN